MEDRQPRNRRRFTAEFKRDAVDLQAVLPGAAGSGEEAWRDLAGWPPVSSGSHRRSGTTRPGGGIRG